MGLILVGRGGAQKESLLMNQRLALAAAAALTLAAGSALAQASAPGSAPPPSSAAPSTASSAAAAPPPSSNPTTEAAPSASSSGSDVSVTTGMDVKDSAGVTIGKVAEVKADADGKKTATIKMGADTFAVDTSSLAVVGGAATVNASQSEIKSMLGKAKK